jgi:hypothetical protein
MLALSPSFHITTLLVHSKYTTYPGLTSNAMVYLGRSDNHHVFDTVRKRDLLESIPITVWRRVSVAALYVLMYHVGTDR